MNARKLVEVAGDRLLGRTTMSAAKAAAATLVDPNDPPRIEFLRNAAEAAGFGFFAPTPHAARPALAAAPIPSPPLEEPPREPLARCSGPPDTWSVQARPSLAAAASPAPARPAHRILLVEDDSTMLQFSVLVLVHAGYQVRAVEGTQAAWEALQSRSYDLLITDNQMPGMSGLELVSKLRSEQLALPVVVASGGIGAEELAQNQRLQPAIALPKPFTSDQLLEAVAEALRRAGRDRAHTEVSFPAYGDSYSHWGLNE